MQSETNPPLSGVVFDIGLSGIVSHLWNGGLQSLAIDFFKPHKKNSKACHSQADRSSWVEKTHCASHLRTSYI